MTHLADLLEAGPILLYDGSCGVCSQAVQWVLKHERSHSLRFAPLESAIGRQLRELGVVAPGLDSLLWAELREGRIRAEIRSSAVLRVVEYVGGPWRFLTALCIVPRFMRDACYRAFAHARYRVRAPSCLVPTKEERARFVGSG
jgi:predicted DCC family thiol-disulfide oxidoreductase YuxK